MIVVQLILFTFFINWCIGLQMLNQTLQKSRQKKLAVMFALITGALAGFSLLL